MAWPRADRVQAAWMLAMFADLQAGIDWRESERKLAELMRERGQDTIYVPALVATRTVGPTGKEAVTVVERSLD